jgi:hypothetical protein
MSVKEPVTDLKLVWDSKNEGAGVSSDCIIYLGNSIVDNS